MKTWIGPLSLSVLVAAMAACSSDDDNVSSKSAGGGGNGGNAGAPGLAGSTNVAGNGASVAGLVRLGTGAGFVGEDPVVMVTAGMPALGYTVFGDGPRLHFFQNGAWGTSVSDPTVGPGVLNSYRLSSFCSDGTSVYLAHTQIGAGAGDLNNHLLVYQYQAGVWTPFGGGELGLSDAAALSPWEPGLSCPAGAEPTVTWVQAQGPSGTSEPAGWVASLTSGSAVRAGPLESISGTQTAADVRVTSVVSDLGGRSYVAAWEDDGQGREQLFVYGIDGASAAAVGTAVAVDQTDASSTYPQEPGIVVASGALTVAWEASLTTAGSRDIFVARWNGSSWASMGGPVRGFPDTHVTSHHPALAADHGVVYLTWVESSSTAPMSLFVAQWTGTEWSLIGGAQNIDPARDAEDPSIAVVDRVIYLAFEEFVDGARQIFVKMGPSF